MDPFLLNKGIDLVDFEDTHLLMFKNDNLYDVSIPSDRKGRSLPGYYEQIRLRGYPNSPVTHENVNTIDDARLCIHIVIEHIIRHNNELTVLDIGAFVGDFAVKIGSLIRTLGCRSKVFAFDPTEAGSLIPYNIELNGLQEIVRHCNIAVMDYSGYMLLHAEPGMSDAVSGDDKPAHRFNVISLASHFIKSPNKKAYLRKLRNYLRPKVGYDILVKTTSINDWMSENSVEKYLFVKIDIEGADSIVIRDLCKSWDERLTGFVFEFNPYSFPSREESGLFLKKLLEKFVLFDIWYSPRPAFCRRIDPDHLDDFISEIAESRIFNYTDILAVSKWIPNSEALCARISNLRESSREYIM